MKWYWVVLLAIVAFIIAYMIGKSNASAKDTLFKGKVASDLNSVMNQISPASGTRISPTTRATLLNRRDSLLKLVNPTPNSGAVLVYTNGGYWNGWGYVNPPMGILTGGAKCKAEGNYWIFDGATGHYICATTQNPY